MRTADNDKNNNNKGKSNNDYNDDFPIGHGEKVNKYASPPVCRVRCTCILDLSFLFDESQRVNEFFMLFERVQDNPETKNICIKNSWEISVNN